MNDNEEIEILDVGEKASNDVAVDNKVVESNGLVESSNIENRTPSSPYNANDTEKDNNSNFKYIMAIILFVVLLLVIYFLPNISKFFSDLNKKDATYADKITTGTLKCTYKKSDKKFDYEYISEFEFENSKILSLDYSSTTTGDSSIDRDELQQKYDKCMNLDNIVKDLNGVDVKCSLNKSTLTEEQILIYASINTDEVISAYSEAGGIYPNFKKGDNIDTIEQGMKASGYTCERH